MGKSHKAPLYTKADSDRIVSPSEDDLQDEPWRSPFRRDYGRLIHCPAFRRLQGKTQLFPAPDSDFFRTRYSHSLEVAQIATSIVNRINATHEYFRQHPLDRDIVETAALAHDLGHPPFGHNGEYALDEKMKGAGGFEGNAQTLRILARLEKRQTLPLGTGSGFEPLNKKGEENRAGLNLTYRTLAAVLKYDNEIPLAHTDRKKPDDICKGYYETESDVVEKIKKAVAHKPGTRFRTVECCIMDIADDIAYSTYDLEDAFKAQFLTPVSIIGQSEAVRTKVIATIKERLKIYYNHLPASQRKFGQLELVDTLLAIFGDVYADGAEIVKKPGSLSAFATAFVATDATFALSTELVTNGYSRTKLTSDLVGSFISGIEVEFNEEFPAQSIVRLNVETFKRVEVLKNVAYQSLIMSPRLKVAEHRGKQIVGDIFDALKTKEGHLLMPDDARSIHDKIGGTANKLRIICDFIACMTDRYALHFYNRLYGTNHESIYAPL
jgi:dGTPase